MKNRKRRSAPQLHPTRTLFLGMAIMALLPSSGSLPGGHGSLSAQDRAAGLSGMTEAQEEQDFTDHFRVYTADGAPASMDDILRAMGESDAVLVGEIHTDPVGHWIEAELLRRAVEAYGDSRSIALSLEMFERDVQGIVDEYLHDLITERQFKASARPWEHYDADYRTMVELAKIHGLPVIAANAPRRYVNRVSRLGPEALSELSTAAKSFLPPLPYPQASEAYRDEWIGLMTDMPMQYECDPPEAEGGEPDAPHHAEADTVPPAHGMAHDTAAGMPPAHDTAGPSMPMHDRSFMSNGLAAQSLWDASMAHAITGFLDQGPDGLVLHMVGGFHVRNHTGTPEMVEFFRPGTRSLVVSMELAEDLEAFDAEEHGGAGDFVILTDKALDLGYERNCLDADTGR
jgi:uncharacterized iron-regulated protein